MRERNDYLTFDVWNLIFMKLDEKDQMEACLINRELNIWSRFSAYKALNVTSQERLDRLIATLNKVKSK